MRTFLPNRRSRLRLALLATIALLLQQLTFAAYACVPHAAPVAAMEHCEGMTVPAPKIDVLCGHYCSQPSLNVSDVRTPMVPPALLPALVPTMFVTLPARVRPSVPAYCASPHPSPPPATILYCTLQI